MDLSEYLKNISFRFLKPKTPRPSGFRGLAILLRRCGIHLEVFNTQLPDDHVEMKRKFKQLCRIPRMSTFAIGSVINRAVAQMTENQAFLNIGVWNGFTFFSGLLENEDKTCIGVDNFSHKNSPKDAFYQRLKHFAGKSHSFCEADFREYLTNIHQQPIGVYLFDGPHTYQDQYDGLALAEPFFSENCIVLVDDTNWEQVRKANLDFMENSPNDYKLLLDERTPNSGHPTFWNGLMVYQMVKRHVKQQDLPLQNSGDTAPTDGQQKTAA